MRRFSMIFKLLALGLEIWNWARWRINKFDCFAEASLAIRLSKILHILHNRP